jgi:hypothetical protein
LGFGVLGFGVWGLVFGVWGLGFGVWGFGWGLGFWMGCRAYDSGLRAKGLGFTRPITHDATSSDIVFVDHCTLDCIIKWS